MRQTISDGYKANRSGVLNECCPYPSRDDRACRQKYSHQRLQDRRETLTSQ